MPLKPKKSGNDYLKYSGLALQFGVLVFLAIWLGGKLDAYFNLKTPIFTIFLILFFFTGLMISIYRDLNKPRKDE